MYRGMISIPYLSREGYPLSVRFRCIQEHNHREHHHGKYNTISGDIARMYGAADVPDAVEELHAAEGELDCLILRQLGFNAVAFPGVDSFAGRHRKILAGPEQLYIWADPDEAGARMVQKITQALPEAIPVRLTIGDVTDTYLEGGEVAIKRALREAKR